MDRPIEGVTVALAAGHGMMWGPGVARVAADLAVHGETSLVDVTDLGLDRFDEHGRSRVAPDPSRCRSRSAPTDWPPARGQAWARTGRSTASSTSIVALRRTIRAMAPRTMKTPSHWAGSSRSPSSTNPAATPKTGIR